MNYFEKMIEKRGELIKLLGVKTKFSKDLDYRGIRVLKNPLDIWNYQEIIEEHNIHWVIETGTAYGGSALYFGDLLTLKKAEGIVISIDLQERSKKVPTIQNHPRFLKNPKVKFLIGSSTDEEIIEEVQEIIQKRRKGKILLTLDSNHSQDHVFNELVAYIPLLRKGDYVIVEDTIAGGPLRGVRRYLNEHPGKLQWDKEREVRFGFSFHPEGYYKKL